MSGRYPQPNGHKQLRGSRYLRFPPKPVPGKAPDPPDWLSPEASTCWRQLAPELHRLGLLTPLDVFAFARLCTYSAWLAEVDACLRDHGHTYEAGGLVKRHPLSAVSLDLHAALLTLFREFGMTPLSRQRLGVTANGDEGDDELERMLREANEQGGVWDAGGSGEGARDGR